MYNILLIPIKIIFNTQYIIYRTTRWLDRCLKAHQRSSGQSIFPIVQGGLDPKLRSECANQLIKREVNGYAVGGLR